MANTKADKNKSGEVIEEFDASMFEAATEWVEQQTGFPPYWNPALDDNGKGNGFKARVMARDERDPEFIRYVLQATMALRCHNGPADDAEEVLVKKGEYFTCSDYAALPLSDYFGEEVVVLTVKKRKLAANEKNPQKRDLWNFKILVSPEVAMRLEERREAQARQLAQEAQAAG